MSEDTERKKPRRTRKPAESPTVLLPEHEPPQDLDMERAVLGSILLDPEVLDDIIPILRGGDFYLEQHQILFRELEELYSSSRQIDAMILSDHLKKKDLLTRIGGPEYLAEVVQSSPTAAHAKRYSEILRDKSKLRQLIYASSAILRDAYEPDVEVDMLVSQAEEKIFQVYDERSTDSVADMKKILDDVWSKIQTYDEKGGAVGLSTGYRKLDEMTGGLHDGELIIVAARPSMGKTAFATNIADHVCIDDGECVLFVSLEMTREELVTRILCGRALVDSQLLRQGRLPKQERDKLQNASSRMMDAPFYVDDTSTRTVSEIAAIARRIQRKEKLKLVVVDYLQLIKEDNPRDSRQEVVAKNARRLKALARELRVPVICIAQLNRESEQGTDNTPKLSQLRESGAIEQDADVVMFVHREGYQKTNAEGGKGEKKDDSKDARQNTKKVSETAAKIILAKQRNGPIGTVKLEWQAKYTKFVEPIYHSSHGNFHDDFDD
ncbi:MAG: replicative DNA helicase [Planctomycetia bacterium]|nr:replicative DNA helicase [Planctomycetia bacterium]